MLCLASKFSFPSARSWNICVLGFGGDLPSGVKEFIGALGFPYVSPNSWRALDFCSMVEINKDLLAKQVWCIIQCHDYYEEDFKSEIL